MEEKIRKHNSTVLAKYTRHKDEGFTPRASSCGLDLDPDSNVEGCNHTDNSSQIEIPRSTPINIPQISSKTTGRPVGYTASLDVIFKGAEHLR